MDYDTLDELLSTVKGLEVYAGRLPAPLYREDEFLFSSLSCKLRTVTLTDPVFPESFTELLRYSKYTLGSLSIPLSPTRTDFDLSDFPNLLHLRLTLEGDPSDYLLEDFEAQLRCDTLSKDEAVHLHRDTFVQGIRQVLPTAQSLKTLTIVTDKGLIGSALSSYKLLDLLPESLIHLSTVPHFLDGDYANQPLLLESIRNRSLPNLRRITVIPSYIQRSLTPAMETQRSEVEKELREALEEYKIEVTGSGTAEQWDDDSR
jgi:hypothetical protein